jgi:hypothetical protein
MPERTGKLEPETDPSSELAAEPAPGSDRRSFLRHLSTDAVWTAGKLAGASAVVRRSLIAAGESAIGTLESATEPAVAHPEDADAASTDEAPVEPAAAAALPVEPKPADPDPAAALTPDQHAFLARGPQAALAVNDPDGHPLLASSIYHWDGAVIRLPARDFTARTVNIARDPRVSLLIEDPGSATWVAIRGIAALVYGDQVEPGIRLILGKYHDREGATIRWEENRSTGDQLVIVVRPTRFVWATRRT